MVREFQVSDTVEAPEGVELNLADNVLKVRGNLGELSLQTSKFPVEITIEGRKVRVCSTWARKKEKAVVRAVASHIRNMITGVTEGFTYRLKVVFAHFPVSLKVSGSNVAIENFQGEKTPRKARLSGNVKVSVEGDDLIVKGIDIENVAQTAANIERATRIKAKDSRVFLDGVYTYSKERGT